jgi:hypothetical protein
MQEEDLKNNWKEDSVIIKGITGDIYAGNAYQDPIESSSWSSFVPWSSLEDEFRARQNASASVAWGQTRGDHWPRSYECARARGLGLGRGHGHGPSWLTGVA